MKWKTLEHNGILFPPPFESQGIKIKIKGEKIDLNLLQEEMVYQWAKKKDTPYVQDKIFQKNTERQSWMENKSRLQTIWLNLLEFLLEEGIIQSEADGSQGLLQKTLL